MTTLPSRPTRYMRERRANPVLRAREQKQQAIEKKAFRLLAQRHWDEYLTILNELRFAAGLGPFTPRKKGVKKKSAIRVSDTVTVDVDAEKQANCPHNEGLKKTTFGKLCLLCGKRIT